MSGDVPNGDGLREPVPILHIDSQPQLEPMVFSDDVPQARIQGLAEALEDLSEELRDRWVCSARREVHVGRPAVSAHGEGDLTIASSRLSWTRGRNL